MASIALQHGRSSFPVLLARYVQGDIDNSMWKRLMALLDADGVTEPERMALARFVNDVVSENGPQSLFVPKEEEVKDLLSETRH